MKQIKFLAVAAALLAITSQTQVFGLTITQVTGTPSIGSTARGISQTSTTNFSTGQTNTTYSTTGTGGGVVQEFKITSTQIGTGYFNAAEVTDVYLHTDSASSTTGTTTWALRIGTISGGTFAAIDTETFASPLAFTSSTWYDFKLSNYVTLNSTSATYAFNITSLTRGVVVSDVASGGEVWSAAANAGVNADLTPGGAATFPNSTAVTQATGALTFYLATTPVPEPSTWAIVPVLGTLAFLGYRRFRAVASL